MILSMDVYQPIEIQCTKLTSLSVPFFNDYLWVSTDSNAIISASLSSKYTKATFLYQRKVLNWCFVILKKRKLVFNEKGPYDVVTLA